MRPEPVALNEPWRVGLFRRSADPRYPVASSQPFRCFRAIRFDRTAWPTGT